MNYRFLVITILWIALIFGLSSIPYLGCSIGGIQEQVLKKSYHVIIFGILTLLIWFSLPGLDEHLLKKFALCGFLALILAISDEIHQRFVPGHRGNVIGVLADVVGIGTVLAYLWIRRLINDKRARGRGQRAPVKSPPGFA